MIAASSANATAVSKVPTWGGMSSGRAASEGADQSTTGIGSGRGALATEAVIMIAVALTATAAFQLLFIGVIRTNGAGGVICRRLPKIR
jgi:hypothetical protein